MTCDDFQRLLHLSRDGELSAEELEVLRRHIASCERCSMEKGTIEGAEKLLGGLRLSYPTPRDPEALTARIMLGIQRDSTTIGPAHLSLPEKILLILNSPPIRIGYATAVALVVCFFLYQTFTLFTNVDDLQERLSTGRTRGTTEVAYVIDETDLRPIVTSGQIRRAASIEGLTIEDGKITVERKSLTAALVRAYRGRLLRPQTGDPSLTGDLYSEQMIRLLQNDVSTRLLFKRGGL